MKKIELIEAASERTTECWLNFDDGSRLISDFEVVSKLDLYVGLAVDEKLMSDIQAESDAGQAGRLAASILSKRQLSRKNLISKLMEKNVSEAAAEAAADRMEKLGAVNDVEYAERIVRHYSSRGWGAMKIKGELYRRGIPKELYEEALDSMEDPSESIEKYIKSKLKNIDEPDRKVLKRISDGLYRRGYTWDEIRDTMAKYNFNED